MKLVGYSTGPPFIIFSVSSTPTMYMNIQCVMIREITTYTDHFNPFFQIFSAFQG